jgi:hypothetical protein
MHDDVGRRGLQRAAKVAGDGDAEPLPKTGDLSYIPAGLRGVNVHASDDAKTGPHRDEPQRGRADRTETDVKHAHRSHGAGL